MRNTFKKIMTAVLAVALLLGVLAVPPQDAQAAGKSYMKGLKLNWDLKKNKAMKYTTSAEVFKKVSGKAKITNYKVKSAGKGYKQLSFNVTFRDDKIKMLDGELRETQTANYFSDVYPIDCTVSPANALFCRKNGTLLQAGNLL